MTTKLTRTLAQILISKYGGNVDHNVHSILLEIIDNSIDALCKNISINVETRNEIEYLTIYDDGKGIDNLNNLLVASHGKKDKIGCKNQGFLDYLMFLSDMKGSHIVYSNYNGNINRLKIKLDNLNKEYNSQSGSNTINIDFDKCQHILMNDITFSDDEDSRQLLENNSKLSKLLEANGTYIEIQISQKINFQDVNIEYFQYMYTNFNFRLNYLDKSIDINIKENISMTNKYKPVYFYLDKKTHANGNEIFKLYSNISKNHLYYKKTKIINEIDETTYNKLKSSYKTKQNIVKTTFTLLSKDDAEKQCLAFDCGIETLRKIWIETNGKLLGLPSIPKKIKGLPSRNLKDIRVVFKINDNELIKNVTMSNKSKTNINNIDNIIIRYIQYLKDYINITYKSTNVDDNVGILDMEKYLKKKYERQIITKPAPKPKPSPKPLPSPSNVLKKVYKWPISCYFGIFNCQDNGILLKGDYIDCKFGYTKNDPRKRESALGSSWRRLNTIFVNDEGCRQSEGKIMIEWEIKSELESLGVEIQWKDDSKEFFRCKLKDFGKINCKIRKIMDQYQNNSIFI